MKKNNYVLISLIFLLFSMKFMLQGADESWSPLRGSRYDLDWRKLRTDQLVQEQKRIDQGIIRANEAINDELTREAMSEIVDEAIEELKSELDYDLLEKAIQQERRDSAEATAWNLWQGPNFYDDLLHAQQQTRLKELTASQDNNQTENTRDKKARKAAKQLREAAQKEELKNEQQENVLMFAQDERRKEIEKLLKERESLIRLTYEQEKKIESDQKISQQNAASNGGALHVSTGRKSPVKDKKGDALHVSTERTSPEKDKKGDAKKKPKKHSAGKKQAAAEDDDFEQAIMQAMTQNIKEALGQLDLKKREVLQGDVLERREDFIQTEKARLINQGVEVVNIDKILAGYDIANNLTIDCTIRNGHLGYKGFFMEDSFWSMFFVSLKKIMEASFCEVVCAQGTRLQKEVYDFLDPKSFEIAQNFYEFFVKFSQFKGEVIPILTECIELQGMILNKMAELKLPCEYAISSQGILNGMLMIVTR